MLMCKFKYRDRARSSNSKKVSERAGPPPRMQKDGDEWLVGLEEGEGEEVKVAAAMVVATAKAKGTAEVETTALPTGA